MRDSSVILRRVFKLLWVRFLLERVVDDALQMGEGGLRSKRNKEGEVGEATSSMG